MASVAVTSPSHWAEACSSAFVPLGVRSAAPGFTGSLDQHVLTPEVSITHVVSSASEVYRSAGVIARHPREDLLISFHLDGAGSVTQNGRTTHLLAGSAALYDAATPYTLAFPGMMSEVVLQLPRRSLPVGSRTLTDFTARSLPSGGPLRAMAALSSSLTQDRTATGVTDGAIADALINLLTAVVNSGSATEAPRIGSELLRLAMHRYIDRNLSDPEFGPGQLASAHHVSLRLVQKLFSDEGSSPAAYIRSRRLQAARPMLIRGESVERTSRATGFGDVDTFSRAFRRAYGQAPSSLHPGKSSHAPWL